MTTIHDPLVLLPRSMVDRFKEWNAPWGSLDFKVSEREGLWCISGFSRKAEYHLDYTVPRGLYIAGAEERRHIGLWYRVDPSLHWQHFVLLVKARGMAIPTQVLRDAVSQGWRQPAPNGRTFVLTYSDTIDGPMRSGWWVTPDQATPASLYVFDEDHDPAADLNEHWPVAQLADTTAMVIGTGSIGGYAAEALARFGVGRMVLVDPDRMLEHNPSRHTLTMADLGRFKVNGLRDRLVGRWPTLEVESWPLNVADDADLIRPLMANCDVIVCATDGVMSRQVANHLARSASKPIVLAAVFENGAFGQIVRVRPGSGCLSCLNRTLEEQDLLAPEPGLDRGYGFGTPHRPMTAPPGDLAVMGELAAKAAVASVLERHGHWTQRLPGDWAVVGLQPMPEMPAPFDVDRALQVSWHELPAPRDDCPTCAPA